MKEQLTRSDDKIRKQFLIANTHKNVIAIGHIYEQRNVALTMRNRQGVSEQYSSFDAMLQTLTDVKTITFL